MNPRPVGLFDIDITSYDGMLMRDLLIQQAVDGFLSDTVIEPMLELEVQYSNGNGPLKYEDFASGILKLWAKGLEGQTVEDVTLHARECIAGLTDGFFPYVSEVINDSRETHDIYFITAEPAFVAAIVTDMFGADGYFASEFEVTDDGRFTGEVGNILATAEEKEAALSRLPFSREGSYALGDSKADEGVLSLVEFPLCMNPDSDLQRIAEGNGWRTISHENAHKTISETALRNAHSRGKER